MLNALSASRLRQAVPQTKDTEITEEQLALSAHAFDSDALASSS